MRERGSGSGASDEPTPGKLTQDIQIAETLIEDIIAWRYEPGSWIREREVAQRFSVSHAPVREAFRHVARAGFVEVVPWRGVRVIELNLRNATETFEVWKALFGAICRLAADRLGSDQHLELLRLLEQYETSVASTHDLQAHTAAGSRLARFIAEGVDAPLADEMFHRVCQLARWQQNLLTEEQLADLDYEPNRAAARQFRVLCGALIARDADHADAAAREFLSITQAHTLAALVAGDRSKRQAIQPAQLSSVKKTPLR